MTVQKSSAAVTPPELGSLVLDTATDKVGEYRGETGARWALRPVGGGPEWEAEPGAVEPAGTYERMRAETARQNARSRGDMA